MTSKIQPVEKSIFSAALVVSALGYFVDVYDLVLFSVVRVASLKSLGVTGDELLTSGAHLLSIQMIGMLVGGVLWGVLGDKKGRTSVLFGSILIYSLANLANAFVTTVAQYELLRFIAGIGLAGELGAGITLVSEILPKEKRGIGTTIVATVGVSGAIAAALCGEFMSWRACYIVGGIAGLVLLCLRIAVADSGMFSDLKKKDIERGSILMLFRPFSRFVRYLSCIAVGLPVWYAVGILVTFSPEIARALGVPGEIKGGRSIMFCYIGLTIGDLLTGLLSQYLKSRKKAMAISIAGTALCSCVLLMLNAVSATTFYLLLIPLGLFVGYWAVFVTTAAEQFGTNLRATAAITIPNFVRGAAAPMTMLFTYWKPSIGVIQSAAAVGVIVIVIAFLALKSLEESFSKDLDYCETS